jgi:nicotinamidase-related amidase
MRGTRCLPTREFGESLKKSGGKNRMRGTGDRALLLIDIQNDYFPGGRMELSGAQKAAEAAGLLLGSARDRGLPVFHIQHVSLRPGASFFLPGTHGVEFHEVVKPLPNETVFIKNYPNSFRETGLEKKIRELGIRELVVAGMMTHMCVDSTVRAAFDLGLDCIVAHDACATKALQWGPTMVPADLVQATVLAALSGVFAQVKDSSGLI